MLRALSLLGVALAACSDSGAPAGDSAAPDLSPADARQVDAPRPDSAPSGPDQFVPFSLLCTVNKIPAAINGSKPYTDKNGASQAFVLAVPTHGFTVDLSWAGSEARPATLRVVADRALGSGAGALAAGTDLASRFKQGAGSASWLVPAALALQPGVVTFTATLNQGATERSSSVTVEAVTKTFMLDPFRLQDTWVIVFSRDLFTIKGVAGAGGKWGITSTKGKNGVADFEEDLRVLGLGTAKMLPVNAKLKRDGATGTNAIVRAWIERLIVAAVRRAYLLKADGSLDADSVRLRVLPEGHAQAPAASSFSYQKLVGGETSKNFSLISVGGGDLIQPFLGRSKTVDLRNVQNEDNLSPGYGVLTTNALGYVIKLVNADPAVKMLLRQLLGGLIPELGEGGKRVGESPLDAQILAPGFDPKKASPAAAERHTKLSFAVELFGRLLGALTAHEMAHSLGLVAGGAPPYGLFGGEHKAGFVNKLRTTPGHIDTPGFNIMEAGPSSAPNAPFNLLSYMTDPRFNALNLAYMQGRILLLPQK